MVVALTLAIFLYVMARKREYAILRALGVPAKQANQQTVLLLLLLGGLGISLGGFSSWNYAINQAKASLSTLPMPAGVSPSADLSPFVLAGLCAAVFLLLAVCLRAPALEKDEKASLEAALASENQSA